MEVSLNNGNPCALIARIGAELADEEMRVIRLPKVSAERKRAYLRAAAGEKKGLADWMLDVCDRAAIGRTGS